jgi:hypothetical protein
MLKLRLGTLSVGLLAAAGLLLALGSSAVGQGGDNDVKKIADLIKKGDMAGAKKAAQEYAKKKEIDEVMYLFKPVKKYNGLGVTGSDQGIEQVLIKLNNAAPTAAIMAKMADSYAEMGYNIAAVGLITEFHAPTQNMGGKKTKEEWTKWTTGSVEAALKLAEAAKAKNVADVKTQASKVNNNCNSCHTIFR